MSTKNAKTATAAPAISAAMIRNFHLTCINYMYLLPYNYIMIFVVLFCCKCVKSFMEYNVHTSIVPHLYFTMTFVKKIYFIFKNNFTRINHCKSIHHKSHLKPFLNYLPCIVHRESFSIIFNVKKCALYSIKYGTLLRRSTVLSLSLQLVFLGFVQHSFQPQTPH